jgi:hypothetical protein
MCLLSVKLQSCTNPINALLFQDYFWYAVVLDQKSQIHSDVLPRTSANFSLAMNQ